MSVTIGPYTFARGEILPARRGASSPQSIVKSEDGVVHVSAGNYDDHVINVRIVDTRSNIQELVAFIRNAARYAMNPFSFTDGYGTNYIVRYWGNQNISYKIIGSQTIEIDLPLRVEVS